MQKEHVFLVLTVSDGDDLSCYLHLSVAPTSECVASASEYVEGLFRRNMFFLISMVSAGDDLNCLSSTCEGVASMFVGVALTSECVASKSEDWHQQLRM